jgi:hypothetical protein
MRQNGASTEGEDPSGSPGGEGTYLGKASNAPSCPMQPHPPPQMGGPGRPHPANGMPSGITCGGGLLAQPIIVLPGN